MPAHARGRCLQRGRLLWYGGSELFPSHTHLDRQYACNACSYSPAAKWPFLRTNEDREIGLQEQERLCH